MKIALYIEDGLEQIVLTPESETEKAILGKLHDSDRTLQIKRGSFFECRGGWMRHQFGTYGNAYGGGWGNEDDSTMLVLRAASAIEARQGEDGAAGFIEDESAVPAKQGDAK